MITLSRQNACIGTLFQKLIEGYLKIDIRYAKERRHKMEKTNQVMTMKTPILKLVSLVLMVALLGLPPASAEEAQEFKGKIAKKYEDSKEWWPKSPRQDRKSVV